MNSHNLESKNKNRKHEEGQVMLLTVIVMATVFLSATAIAGALMVYQLGQVAKVVESAEAVFAADSGIERGLFTIFRCNAATPAFPAAWQLNPGDINSICASASNLTPTGPTTPQFINSATYKMGVQPAQNSAPDTVTSIRATGNSGRSARAFEILF